MLNQLRRSKGLKDKKIQVGRGNGSGKGNSSTKGLKGQNSLSGGGVNRRFEWGQTSLSQRLPKLKGFKRYEKLVDHYHIVNISTLEKSELITSWATIDKQLLLNCRMISHDWLVKILGNGELTKSLHFVNIDKFSDTAKTKITTVGGDIKQL